MRIDLLMNKLCLVKTRSIAKKACDKGLVLLNGKQAKASATVSAGDELQYEIYGYRTTLKITQIPAGNVSKASAPQYYEMLGREQL